MLTVEILRGVVAGGGPRKAGERIEVPEPEARLLVGVGKARIVDSVLPVVLSDAPEPSQPKRRGGRKPKTDGASAPSATNPDPMLELSSDAPAAAE